MKLIPEWKDHEKCLIAWPCNKDLYGSVIEDARLEIANFANQISDDEQVEIYCNSSDFKECLQIISNSKINITQTNLDDSWMRDIAPIFYKNNGRLESYSFNFNGYGKYPNYENDNKLSEFISGQLKLPIKKIDLTLEGGAITYDENGNLFTTESVLLNPNRSNPKKNIIEEKLTTLFDLNSIIWLPTGLEGDDTDGHIDNIFCPIGDQRYLIAKSNDQTTFDYKSLTEANLILNSKLSLTVNNLKIIEIPLPSNKIIHNKKLVASYINFYSTKNTIFIPKFNVKEDEEVYDIFKSLFNNKKIEMIESANINYGGGNLHCITMNVPKL
mgnify:FL=1